MRQETFTILFLMRKGRPKKNGLASVYARITTGSLRQEFYFHCEGKPELWNQKKERMMGTSRLAQKVNKMLNEFRVQILDVRSKLLAEGYTANAAQIKQRYLNPTCNTMMLIPGLTDYVKRRQAEVCVARSRVLPTPSNQKMNAYMKEIAAVCGIDKVLTTYCARHTFACMAVEYGMPIDVLAKILGHSNTNMTRHYAKFSETVIGREMEAFGERLASAT